MLEARCNKFHNIFYIFFLLEFEKTIQNKDCSHRKNILIHMFKAKFLALGIK